MLFDAWKKLETDAPSAAKRLIGSLFIRSFQGGQAIGRIVETEAYDETDAASHSYKGKTRRTEVMFGPPGFLYVYFTYGMHYCCNVVCGPAGTGSAVLIRGIEPIRGIGLLSANRHVHDFRSLTNGPAKICQAFRIDTLLSGHDLSREPLQLSLLPPIAADMIEATPRVGITRAMEKRWRFILKNSEFLSKR